MKKKSLSLGLLLALLVILAFWRFKSCGNSSSDLPPCTLPAPNSLTVNITSPSTASLSWQPIEGANGYLVEVTDSTTNLPFGTFNVPLTENSLVLNNLIPEHVYQATVRGKCKAGQASSNEADIVWKQSSIIIVDVVVMRDEGTGMDNTNCNCPGNDLWKNVTIINGQFSLPFAFASPPNDERAIFQIKATLPSGRSKTIKLAIDENCLTELKYFGGSCDGDNDIAAALVSGNTSIQFTGSGKSITVSPVNFVTASLIFNVAFSNCTGNECTLTYRVCTGSWDGDCSN